MRQKFAVSASLFSLLAVAISIAEFSPLEQLCSVPPGEISFFAFAPNDRVFAVLLHQPDDRANYQLMVIDHESRRTLLHTTGLVPTNLCFNADAKSIAVLWADGVRIYTLADGRCVQTIEKKQIDHRKFPDRGLYAMAFSDDGKRFIMASEKHASSSSEAAWDLETGMQTQDFGPASYWSEFGMALDRSKWVTGGWPGPTPRVIDREENRRITACFRYPYHIFCSFTRDSKHLLTLHKDGAMFLWELRDTGGENATILQSQLNTGLERSLAFALLHQSDRLAYIDSQRKIRFRRLFAKTK